MYNTATMIVGWPNGRVLGIVVGGLIGFVCMMLLAAYLVGTETAAGNDARNILPITSTLPPMLGDPPSSAYPGSSANGWTPTAVQSYVNVPSAGGCIQNGKILSAFATRSYYYDNSTTIKGSDQASMTIDVYVEPSVAAAKAAQAQVHTQRYRKCYAQDTADLLNQLGMQVVKPTTVSPILIDTEFPTPAFQSESIVTLDRGLHPYYDATAVMRYGRYRAIVDIGRCCQPIPFATLQNAVDYVQLRMRAAPETNGPNWMVILILSVVVVLSYTVVGRGIFVYSQQQQLRRESLSAGSSGTYWSTERDRRRRG